MYEFRWKGLIGKWRTRIYGPLIVNEIFAGRTIKVVDSGNAHIFVVKGKKFKSYEKSEKTSEKASPMLAEP